ncbi:MAG: hypothetical protein QXD48_00120 [Candidatus Aenigmatarchaeota archaeon]
MKGCYNFSGKFFLGIICAAIFGSLFVASIVHGFVVQVTGETQTAIVFYFVGFLLLAITKICIQITKEPVNVAKKKK